MRQVWYIHKYYQGVWRGRMRVTDQLDRVDKWTKKMFERYGDLGWTYDISGSCADPRRRLVNELGQDPEIASLVGVHQ